MSSLPLDELLAPLSEAMPCGEDLEYDPAFVALETAARGKPEQQFGEKVIAAEEPDWRAVHEQAQTLAERTRDLRVAVLLTRSGARVHGAMAYAQGLALTSGLLQRHWPQVHPLLDADDNDDPTMRMNALAPLLDADSGMADLRQAAVGSGRQAITVRHIELAFGKVDARAGESAPSQEGVVQALKGFEAASPGWLPALRQIGSEASRIEQIINEHVGAADAPEWRPLHALARCLTSAADLAAGAEEAAAQPDGALPGSVATHAQGGGPGSLNTRDDVLRALDSVCNWLERHEPTNPAPLLIRRAQRLMKKGFLDIIRDLAPDGFDQVEKIAGTAET